MASNRYYATFIPGMQKTVEAIIRERLKDVKIEKLLDGAVLFETQCAYDKLNFFCFNNIFAVISVIEYPGTGAVPAPGVCCASRLKPQKIAGQAIFYPANSENSPDNRDFLRHQAQKIHKCNRLLEAHMYAACRAGPSPVIAENTKKIRSFRIVCSRENTPAAVDERLRRDTERYIAAQSALAPDRSRPDTEFWFLSRREGFSVFMKRLTRHGSFEKTLHPGELPPPVAYLLCRLSGPKPGGVAADPFCGYGAIPAEYLKRFPAARFYASDRDGKAAGYARKKLAGYLGSRCTLRRADVYELPALLPPGSLDAIITDPPWGFYAEAQGPGVPIERFYADVLEIFTGLLKPGGAAVVLTARQRELTDGAARTGKLEISDAIPVLLSGKKAAVFVLKKR